MEGVCQFPNRNTSYVSPEVELLENNVVKNEGVVVFLISAAFLISVGFGVYCTWKGGDFEFAFKINPFTIKIGCNIP